MPTPSSYISSWVVILRDSACFKDYANWLVLGTFVLVEGYKIGYIYVVDVLTRGFHGCVILRSLTGVNFNGFTYLKYDRANVRRACVYRKKLGVIQLFPHSQTLHMFSRPLWYFTLVKSLKCPSVHAKMETQLFSCHFSHSSSFSLSNDCARIFISTNFKDRLCLKRDQPMPL